MYGFGVSIRRGRARVACVALAALAGACSGAMNTDGGARLDAPACTGAACGDSGAMGDGAAGPDGAPGMDATTGGSDGAADGATSDAGGGVGQPRALYTDLESGPNTGGQDNKGAFVTVYGHGFGATRGSATVTIGGGAADNYPVWSDTRVAFQLGAAARSGPIVVHTARGDSNPLPFTVRDGAIHFVAPSGNDSADGSYATPWRTVPHAVHGWHAGDTVYVLNGVTQSSLDNYNAALSIQSGGAAGNPVALVAYPGATVTIGSPTGPEYGIRTPLIAITAHDIVLAGLVLRGGNTALAMAAQDDWRVVGCDMSCPNGDGATACVESSEANHIAFLGNEVHDSAIANASKLYHAVYFSSDSSHVEVGWNHVHDNRGCRGIQFHSSPLGGTSGANQFDLDVHDNLIHGIRCDGINFATVDPSRGPVRAYNNVIYDVGRGPDPHDGSSDYAGIYVAGITNTGTDGHGAVEVFNNTLYNCGAHGGGDSGAFSRGTGSPMLVMNLRNNVVVAMTGESYLTTSSTMGIAGSNNLWTGAGAAPARFTMNVAGDPLFVNAAGHDFHLRAGSPALDSGVDTMIATDYDGTPRPQGTAFDLGAFELAR